MRSCFSKTVTAVAGAAELLGGGEAGGTGADDGDALAGAMARRFGHDPAFVEGAVDDGLFDCLMVTGGSLMPSTQAASQGAGQMRPVNSGKLLVACRTRMASRQRPR